MLTADCGGFAHIHIILFLVIQVPVACVSFMAKMATNMTFLSRYKITCLFPLMLLALNSSSWNMLQTESLSTQYFIQNYITCRCQYTSLPATHSDACQHLLPDSDIKWYGLCRHTMCPYLILGLPVFTLAAHIHMKTVHFLLWHCCNC